MTIIKSKIIKSKLGFLTSTKIIVLKNNETGAVRRGMSSISFSDAYQKAVASF